jgi:hypothetical protein
MAYSQLIQIHSNKPLPAPTGTRKNSALLRQYANWLVSALAGTAKVQGFEAMQNTAAAKRAAALLVYSGASGTVGITINGVNVTVATGASDTATMTSTVAAVNASSNALVQYLVEASNTRGTVALASVVAGTKLQLGQYEFVAVSGTPTNYGQFDISGSNAADAASLVSAINQHPAAGRYYHAFAASGSATVQVFRFATPPNGTRFSATATTMTIVQSVAAATGCVRSINRNTYGNCITVAASGTGASITDSQARLIGGTGDSVALQQGLP